MPTNPINLGHVLEWLWVRISKISRSFNPQDKDTYHSQSGPLYHSQADTHEELTVSLVLCVELGHNGVQSRVGGRVQSSYLNLEIVDQIEVGVAAGNVVVTVLTFTFMTRGRGEVEEVDVTDDIGLE
jgi:hypothetical protein